ncbi:MAG TPA: Pr6Pr family membrane protein [Ruminiclostridium sp.]
MCIHNRLLALIFRITFLFGCGLGLYLNSGLRNGELAPYMLIFYTIQSNALCFIFFSILIVKNILDLKAKGIKGSTMFFTHFKGAVTMSIAVTLLIYHFILVPKFLSLNPNYNIFSWQNMLVHYFVPIIVILDWIVFDEKLSFYWFDPILWLTIPITYLIFVFLRANLGEVIAIVKSQYPYFFLDVNMLGWEPVLKNVSILMIGFLFLGYSIYIIDRISFEQIALRKANKVATEYVFPSTACENSALADTVLMG